MPVPYPNFASATTSIPLSQLDNNFATTITLGNVAIQLGNVVTSLGNVTLTNTTISGLSGGSANGVVYINSSNVAVASPAVLAFDGTNLGLGVTPSAWGSSVRAMQFQGGVSIFSGTSGLGGVGNNVYSNPGTADYYIANGYATRYYQYNGTHVWNTAASGTAGNVVSFITAMTLDASNNLLVGTTSTAFSEKFNSTQSANYKAGLFFNTNSSFTNSVVNLRASRNTTNSTYNFLQCSIDGVADKLYIYDSGNVVNANNSYGAISDIKLKENIVDATPKLEKLNQVRVVNFNFIGDQQKQLGVVAQELEQVFPSMVEESPDRDAEGNNLGTTTKSVKYSVFVPMLIKAIQEQQAMITALQTQVTALKAKVGV